MKPIYALTMIAALLIASQDSRAESAQDILDAAWNAQVERWKGVDSYLVEQSVMGMASKQYLVRTSITDDAGISRIVFLPAADAGLEPGCVNPHSTTQVSAGRGDTSAEYLSWFMGNAELIGEESVNGATAWKLRADGVDRSQQLNQEQMSITSMTMWLSKDGYLPLKMRMEGTAMIEGQSRPVTMDMLSGDFRKVQGSQLVEPFRRIVSISGMVAGIDEEQIAEARAAMAEFEKELASMPESQRAMVQSMMGPRMEQMRKLAESGSFESEIIVQSITPNPEAFGERIVACNAG